MPIRERVAPTPKKTILKLLPDPAQTFAVKKRKLHNINIVSGEVKAIVDKYAPRRGIIRIGVEQRTTFGRVPTSVLAVDLCLAGGFKRSQGTLLVGNKSTGKTTLSLLAIANALRLEPDSMAAFVDIEGTLDLTWAQRLGVDIDRLLVVEPESGEEACDLTDGLFRSAEICAIAVDSIAMLTPMKEVQDSAEVSHVGNQPRLVNAFLRRIHNAMLTERHRGHYPILALLNQYRMKIGVTFGDPRVLPGGMGLEYSASQGLQTYNKEHKDEKTDMVLFNEHDIVVTKEKTGGRLKAGKFKLIRNEETGYPVGFIPQARTMCNWGAPAGIITGRYQLAEFGRFNTYDDIDRFFVERPEVCRNLCWRITEYYRTKWGVS